MLLHGQAMTSRHKTGLWPQFQPGGGNITRQHYSSISLCTRAKPSSTLHSGRPTLASRQAPSGSTSSRAQAGTTILRPCLLPEATEEHQTPPGSSSSRSL